jgi:thiol-disulfide isomerase/thioredoxin
LTRTQHRSRWRRHIPTAHALVVALIGALAGANAQAIEPGDAAPRCELLALTPGPRIDTAALSAGHVVLVDFWASWCAPCAHAFPHLGGLQRDYLDAGFLVLGINVDEEPGDALAFLERHPVDFAVGSDRDGACPRAYDVQGMPSSYLVDRAGIVRSVNRGFRPEAVPELRREIEALLAEPTASSEAAKAR